MSLQGKFGTDKTATEQGAWIEIVENEDGSLCRIRVRRTNQRNKEFTKQIANHRKAFENLDRLTGVKLEQAEASMIEVMINTIITDWENVVEWEESGFPTEDTKDGKLKFVPFNKENARRMLLAFPDLKDLLVAEADDITNFQAKESELKN